MAVVISLTGAASQSVSRIRFHDMRDMHAPHVRMSGGELFML